MAKNRYVGGYPVIGIRPIVDGRRGPMMLRESLEPLVWAMQRQQKSCLRRTCSTRTASLSRLLWLTPASVVYPRQLLAQKSSEKRV